MSLHRLQIPLLLAATLASSVARAQEAKSDPVVYEFGEDLVRGSSKSSNGEVLHVRPRPKRESLVRVREHWLPELFRTVEDL